ncbi:MAG: Mur ligase domain-containing protein [Alkalibacterium sp.]|nr:Mur ligase domain-containing protein [Alkalibacterium sp.]
MPNALFVCIEGYETDGHAYAGGAVENGAVALVVERFLPEVAALRYTRSMIPARP